MTQELTTLQKNRFEQVTAIEDEALNLLDEWQSSIIEPDGRWMAIARTHLEQGFMAFRRAVADGKRASD